MRLWQNMVSGVDELRLEVALKMLKSPHFNAKMNSLKEVCMEEALILITSAVIVRLYLSKHVPIVLFSYQVCKLIEDSEKNKNTKVSMSQDAITEWLLQNKVLSIAFESESLPMKKWI